MSPLSPSALEKRRECLAPSPRCSHILRNSDASVEAPGPSWLVRRSGLLGRCLAPSDDSMTRSGRSDSGGRPGGTREAGTDLRSNFYPASCPLGDRGMLWSSLSSGELICTTGFLCLSGLWTPCRRGWISPLTPRAQRWEPSVARFSAGSAAQGLRGSGTEEGHLRGSVWCQERAQAPSLLGFHSVVAGPL